MLPIWKAIGRDNRIFICLLLSNLYPPGVLSSRECVCTYLYQCVCVCVCVFLGECTLLVCSQLCDSECVGKCWVECVCVWHLCICAAWCVWMFTLVCVLCAMFVCLQLCDCKCLFYWLFAVWCAVCKHTVHTTILHSVETQTNTPNSQTSAKRSHITQVETHSTSHLTFYTVWKHKQEQTQ